MLVFTKSSRAPIATLAPWLLNKHFTDAQHIAFIFAIVALVTVAIAPPQRRRHHFKQCTPRRLHTDLMARADFSEVGINRLDSRHMEPTQTVTPSALPHVVYDAG
ncbi:hypothetical protein CC86DRAFT_368991 [Ophiobolus disseminans]|uniref:Uncharacterized protein n=1 Tax=Ophiobolus disseminans TaxID=1469910 RepID=A0A6A7A6S8_9PLEO|nr:hypothetical protein CC86DRAFT_368991 [Ophiobolus disseminans]